MSRIRKNIAWKTLGTAIEKGLRLVLVGYVARALGIRVYGQYTYAVAVAMLAVQVADMGLGLYLAREVARAEVPPPRLIIVGAVHIAQSLAPMATMLEFDVTVVDPRGAWATTQRFPGVKVIKDWADEAFQAMGLDSSTAVVTLTHDPKLDDPALESALKSDVFYIGALGSKRTHAKRKERLAEVGITDTAGFFILDTAGNYILDTTGA